MDKEQIKNQNSVSRISNEILSFKFDFREKNPISEGDKPHLKKILKREFGDK